VSADAELIPLSSLRDEAQAGHRSTLLAQGVRFAAKALSVLVLARLVAPADHGRYAMAASVTLFLLLFRDLSLGPAAVQAPTLDATQQATLLRVHAGLGVILTLLTLALAPVARWFYGEPTVIPLLATMSVSFLFIGAGGYARTQLARELRFRQINFLETVAALLGTALMVVAGMVGAGAYAFVVFLLVTEAAHAALAWRALRHRPRGAFRLASIRDLLRTGTQLTSYHVLGFFLQQLDTYAIGQAFGARALGLYSRSSQLLALPTLHVAAPLTQVVLATLSRLGPESPHFRAEAVRRVTMIAHLTLPLAAVCFTLPEETVRVVLGSQWPEAAPILRWLAVTAAASALGTVAYGINVAASQTRRLFRLAAVMLPLTAVAIAIGLRNGPEGVARALALANLAFFLPRLAWTLRGSPVALRDYLAALAGPALTSLALAGGLVLGARLVPDAAPLLRLLAGAAGGLAALAVLALVFPRFRHQLADLCTLLPWTR
jgi:O-antigen/teichoic acid export membrane protein